MILLSNFVNIHIIRFVVVFLLLNAVGHYSSIASSEFLVLLNNMRQRCQTGKTGRLVGSK